MEHFQRRVSCPTSPLDSCLNQELVSKEPENESLQGQVVFPAGARPARSQGAQAPQDLSEAVGNSRMPASPASESLCLLHTSCCFPASLSFSALLLHSTELKFRIPERLRTLTKVNWMQQSKQAGLSLLASMCTCTCSN